MSYQDDLVSTQLVAGLYNSEHQAKILSESSNLNRLDDKLQRLLVLERSDASVSSLNTSDPVNGSAYSNVIRSNFNKKDRFDKSRKKQSQQRNQNTKPPGAPTMPRNDGESRNDRMTFWSGMTPVI